MTAVENSGQPIVDRPRLLVRFGKTGRPRTRVTVLSAPLGYGKTLLVQEWAKSLDDSTITICVDAESLERDSDLWQRALSGMEGIDNSGSAKRPGNSATAFRALVRKTAADVVLIVDAMEPNAGLEEALLRMVESVPNLFVVAAGRSFAFLNSAVAAARAETSLITARDLRFDEKELQELVTLRRVSEAGTAWSRCTQLHGWPRFCQAFLTELQRGKSVDAAMELLRWECESTVSGPASLQILELLKIFHDAPLSFLSEAAELPLRETGAELTLLQELGCVVGTYLDAQWWVSFSPAFAGFEWGGTTRFSQQKLEELQLLYASATGEQKTAEALRVLLGRHDLQHANEFAIRQFSRLMLDPDAVTPLLEQLPMKRLEGYPGMLALALTLARPNMNAPLEHVGLLATKLLEAVLDEQGEVPENTGITELAFVTGAERMLGHWEAALTHARRLEGELAEFEDRHEWQSWSGLPTIYAVVSLVGNLTGDHALALRAATRVRQIAIVEENVAEEVRAGYQAALTYAQLMDFSSAARKLAAADALRKRSGVKAPEFSAVSRLIAQIWVHMWEGELETAKDLAAESADLLVRMEHWPLFVQAESWLMLLTEGPGAAREHLQQRIRTQHSVPLSRHVEATLAARLATLAMLEGDVASARAILESATHTSPATFAAKARLALIKGDLVQAGDQIERARYLTTAPAVGTDVCLLAAIIHWESGDRAEAFTLLKQIEAEMNSQKNRFVCTEVPYQSLLALARAAAEEGAANVVVAVEGLPAQWRWNVHEPLSPAELKVLKALRSHGTVPKAAKSLAASPNTVKAHVRRIYSKLGVSNRAEMLQAAEKGDVG